MSALEKIRKQAAQFEHDRQYDRALGCYARLLDGAEGGDDIDVALFNRAGDVAVRAGQVERAVHYFERALDLYAAGGLLNNAIAVGVKVLRHAPGHVAAHYTLGVLYAKKGFRSDARYHLLAYAERMHRGGHEGEAGRALGEFAALTDGAESARAELERHVGATPGRAPDAVRALCALLDRALAAAPDVAGARPARSAEGGTVGARAGGGLADLVFLDVGFGGEPAAPAGDDPAVALTAGFEPTSLGGPPPSAATPRPAAARVASPSVTPPAVPHTVTHPAGGDVPPLRFAASLPGEPAPMTLAWVQVPVAPPEEASSPETGDLVFLQDAPAVALLEVAADEAADAAVYEPASDAGSTVGSALEFLTFEDAPGEALAGAGPLAPLVEPLVEPLDLTLPEPVSRPVAPAAAPMAAEEHVDLGDWLRSEEPEVTTRMTAAAPRQTEDEDAAFAEALRAFKAGVARSVPDADFDSHYDLGIAYKEMGLLDEAIGALQKAARAPGRPLRALEALGQCFLDRGEPALALAALDSVARELEAGRGADDASAVGVCYLLATACERLGRVAEARRWFVRVLAIDFTFRDAAPRLASLPAPD